MTTTDDPVEELRREWVRSLDAEQLSIAAEAALDRVHRAQREVVKARDVYRLVTIEQTRRLTEGEAQ